MRRLKRGQYGSMRGQRARDLNPASSPRLIVRSITNALTYSFRYFARTRSPACIAIRSCQAAEISVKSLRDSPGSPNLFLHTCFGGAKG